MKIFSSLFIILYCQAIWSSLACHTVHRLDEMDQLPAPRAKIKCNPSQLCSRSLPVCASTWVCVGQQGVTADWRVAPLKRRHSPIERERERESKKQRAKRGIQESACETERCFLSRCHGHCNRTCCSLPRSLSLSLSVSLSVFFQENHLFSSELKQRDAKGLYCTASIFIFHYFASCYCDTHTRICLSLSTNAMSTSMVF